MAKRPLPPELRPLMPEECVHYRDKLRAARYAALADAESFTEVCFVLEALGLRLLGMEGAMGSYKPRIARYAKGSPLFGALPQRFPATFKSFDALYETVRHARNDAMHTGAYARHATEAAIELCIGLEEALMAKNERRVGDVMVKSPISAEPWQPVAQARQMMLIHSFPFLPVRLGDTWYLVSELGLARYLSVEFDLKVKRLGYSIEEAKADGMELKEIPQQAILSATDFIDKALNAVSGQEGPTLWLVIETVGPEGRQWSNLAGVLSPFELM